MTVVSSQFEFCLCRHFVQITLLQFVCVDPFWWGQKTKKGDVISLFSLPAAVFWDTGKAVLRVKLQPLQRSSTQLWTAGFLCQAWWVGQVAATDCIVVSNFPSGHTLAPAKFESFKTSQFLQQFCLHRCDRILFCCYILEFAKALKEKRIRMLAPSVRFSWKQNIYIFPAITNLSLILVSGWRPYVYNHVHTLRCAFCIATQKAKVWKGRSEQTDLTIWRPKIYMHPRMFLAVLFGSKQTKGPDGKESSPCVCSCVVNGR